MIMHMADALLSPVVGGVMTAVSAAAIGVSVKKTAGERLDEKKVPMMGVMGAFVFAAQMINFTIPGTGSSGHIAGSILLSALLGPFPALLTIACVLLIQCLFFADGGLLAYGCNVFNMGVVICLFAYQFIYKPIVKKGLTKKNIIIASILSSIAGLQIGAFCVVLETFASGIVELPFGVFAALMQPIHLAIGLVEGVITAAVLCFVHTAQPALLDSVPKEEKAASASSFKKVLVVFIILTLLTGGILSLFASSFPDGLEWSIEGITGSTELERSDTVHDAMGDIVDTTALMPDYSIPGIPEESPAGTAAAGITGSVITVILAGGIGLIIQAVRKKPRTA